MVVYGDFNARVGALLQPRALDRVVDARGTSLLEHMTGLGMVYVPTRDGDTG